MTDFDIEAAQKAGYSEKEIADFLASKSNFKVNDARKAGYSDNEVIPWLVKNIARPMLEYGGLTGGAIAGGAMGAPTGPGAALTGVAGGTLGYGMGRQAANLLEEGLGMTQSPQMPERLAGAGRDLVEGAELEMGGQLIGKGLGIVGKGAQQALGRLTGTGTGAVEQAVIGSQSFKDALRGKIQPREIVEHARDALNVMKTKRGEVYRAQLEVISKYQGNVDTKPIADELISLMKQYRIPVAKSGTFYTDRIAMGKAGRNDITEVVELVQGWGSKPGDNTVAGLDVLKRQLDDFYSDSSQARAFVTALKKRVEKTIIAAEPKYLQMTKDYADATRLIKDIESDLMMRKQGMSGRITADQTLRRLTSALKDNFALRRDLVDALGNQTAKDLQGEIAGHAMSSFIPRGISGSGLAATNAIIAYTINPKIWPILAASSPRVSAEFLNVFGKALRLADKPVRIASERWISWQANPERETITEGVEQEKPPQTSSRKPQSQLDKTFDKQGDAPGSVRVKLPNNSTVNVLVKDDKATISPSAAKRLGQQFKTKPKVSDEDIREYIILKNKEEEEGEK